MRCAPPPMAQQAIEDGHHFAPDLVILDLGLPRVDGLDVARSLRENDDVPILILTARDALESRVEGLDAGADDYLVKPFERQELLARMRALLRRRPPRGSAPLRVGDLSLERRHARGHARASAPSTSPSASLNSSNTSCAMSGS